MNDPTPILTVTGLSAGYGAGAMVADASFTLRRGEILCLVGESGCGKSTLLRAVMGVTPGLQLLSGEIFVNPVGDGRRAMDREMGWFHACSSYPLTDLKIKIPIL